MSQQKQRKRNPERDLSDTYIKNRKAAARGQRDVTRDKYMRGLSLVVTDTGHKSFVLSARFGGPGSNPTRRCLGEYPDMGLAEAREKAAEWRELIKRGKDPKFEEERQRRAELRKRKTTFGPIVEKYLDEVVVGPDAKRPKQRQGQDVARGLRREFCSRWQDRPIDSIDRLDATEVLTEVAARAPYMAHSLFSSLRSFFNWAVEIGYLENSPCDRIRIVRLLGEKKPRQRVLDSNELRAFWRATECLGYPRGSVLRLLLHTGCRVNEIAEATWSEVDLDDKFLAIPPHRFKSDATHLVPLTDEAVAIFESLPRFTKGDYVFSFSSGERPVGSWDKAKSKLNRLMGDELGRPVEAWKIHDLRRVVRSQLASLRVPDMIAEMILGHGKRGLQRVYDQHHYLDEMREALEQWAAKLRDIVEPPPVNVVSLETARA